MSTRPKTNSPTFLIIIDSLSISIWSKDSDMISYSDISNFLKKNALTLSIDVKWMKNIMTKWFNEFFNKKNRVIGGQFFDLISRIF